MNFRAGLAAAAVYNVNRRKGARPIEPLQLFRRRERPKQTLSVVDLKQWVLRKGGQVVGG